MGHIEDRWYKTVAGIDDKPKRVKTDRFGLGERYRVRYIAPAAGRQPFSTFAEAWLRNHHIDESSRESVEFRVRKHVIPFSVTGQFRRFSRTLSGSGLAALSESTPLTLVRRPSRISARF